MFSVFGQYCLSRYREDFTALSRGLVAYFLFRRRQRELVIRRDNLVEQIRKLMGLRSTEDVMKAVAVFLPAPQAHQAGDSAPGGGPTPVGSRKSVAAEKRQEEVKKIQQIAGICPSCCI